MSRLRTFSETDPSAVLFGLTTEFIGSWLTTIFSWIVLTSLFAKSPQAVW